ncbi:MAG TPA: hypothetical protein PK095_19355, partial [Myxococcota bacterium]|nr:hypothetical protein [Myxococcota bacterium]
DVIAFQEAENEAAAARVFDSAKYVVIMEARKGAPGGTCGLGAGARIYKEYIHFGEERRLLPSHTIYFTGCSFRCAFCS